jgi:Protein of unknown function (DUF3551)
MSITFMNRTSRVAIAARSMILATVIALAASVFGRHPAKAYEAPWCAVISDGYWDCQYRSFEECYRKGNVLAGNRGFCDHSPYYVAGSAEQRQARKRRARPQ